jgi:predicted metalloendopeptidase
MTTHTPHLRAEITDTIRPGDDFYAYVNAKWLSAHPMPGNKSRMGAFTEIGDENIERLRVLLEEPDKEGASWTSKLAKQFYRAAMDEAHIASLGMAPVRSLLNEIQAIHNVSSLKAYIARRHSTGFGFIWHGGLDVDEKDCTRYVFRMSQSGLGLPDREYYLEAGERFVEIRSKYRTFLTQLFSLCDITEPEQAAEAVLRIETKLATFSSTATERRDIVAQYNPYTLAQLPKAFPGLDWRSYLKEVGCTLRRAVLVSQPKFLAGALQLLEHEPVEAWKEYAIFHGLLPLLPALPKQYELLNFSFYGTVLGGTTEQEPRYRRAINTSMSMLPEPVGQVFTDAYFSEHAKAAIYDLVEHVKTSLHRRIEGLVWMSSATKQRAFEKLHAFRALLGYPDTWRNYDDLTLGDSYVANIQTIRAYEWRYDMARLSKRVDRSEWLMSPATVNAYYWSNTNTITFPAGILQPPFFDAEGDFAANYGGIGAVIGHEIIHGFDDKGSLYDAIGNLHSWWTDEDRKEFDERTAALAKQYDAYMVDGRPVNGALTLGENIADLGGVLIAHGALRQKLSEDNDRRPIQGFTPEQRFFMAWARVWRMNIRPELALRFLLTDPHAPNHLRVNGVLRNIDAFYDAFNIPSDAVWFTPEAERIRIW